MMSVFPRPESIIFTIPADAVAQYRVWRAHADHTHLRAQLDHEGFAMIVGFRGERCFTRITELPALGDAEPWYGSFGGGYPFIFQPHRAGCDLTITSPASVQPIQLSVPAPHLLYEPIATPGDYGILEECPPDAGAVWRFAISAPRFQRLVDGGWDAAVIGAYSYEFTPTNVGCIVYVRHEASGEMILLADADAF